ncbi:hypothetical protein N5918_05290 [Glaesserella parasuis]|uniref:Glycosyltransferase n=1 Tax=Glaesserella parasuis TaxID=738 RepID=T1RPM0_GLAPU|nr:hypothetical protein [Glaesserella parasuis]EQA01018.1 hypothetical protein HPSSW114_1202 [Glaesserella parasuis SW114]AGM38667.1 hypothetical protein [Glaesserella parasuis]MDD2172512.1 hypothetical protein [Glaesserella parasuis]MDG6462744.1 hypothetical protein [Glaesserella parasuis]MDP0271861.1 hypothetical protein [Glaesserella parasuis]
MIKFLLRKGEINDATAYYIGIIKKHLEYKGKQVEIVHSVYDIQKTDEVWVITAKTFSLVWLKNPKQQISIWFQGIVPEEAMLTFEHTLFSKYIRKFYHEVLEKIALKYAKNIFFVSKSMFRHYQKKYGYLKSNYTIMPCFNQKLNIKGFNQEKYQHPTFLYAGALSKWQCIDRTLLIFKKVQQQIPNAKLFLFTSEKEKAKSLVEQYDIKNINIDYVAYNELNEKIKHIKYGFLIRDDNSVNNVATPTKMNGYLANGIIPIYSNVVDDFKENLKSQFLISADTDEDLVNKIVFFEQIKINNSDIYEEYSLFFKEYYNDEYYVQHIEGIAN